MSVLDRRFGFSIAEGISVTGAFTSPGPIAIAKDSDVINSNDVPHDCFIESLELELSSISDGDKVTVYLARDSAGNVPLTSAHLDGATQRVTVLNPGVSTTGGCSFQINKDFHFDGTVSSSTKGTLYLLIKCVDSGGVAAPCTADARLNWRA
jgi:hypothetical protein